MGFKNFLREYFTFSRTQRNGVYILLFVILALMLYLSFSDRFLSHDKTDFSQFDKDITQFEAEQKQRIDSVPLEVRDNFAGSNSPDVENEERSPFNPNNLPDEDWKRMGLSDKQVKVIKNYESKGGKFRSKEDVKKMYCITPELYASLEQYIRIPADTSHQHEMYKKFEKEKISAELNSADTVELDKLKGIGFAYAKRIIKYRDLLGGFVKKEQLLEVYGFDKERYDGLAEQITVDIQKVKLLDLNTVTLDELKKHPYIKYNIANLIVNYRKQHGNYRTVEDIKKLNLMNEELFTKLAPYLKVE